MRVIPAERAELALGTPVVMVRLLALAAPLRAYQRQLAGGRNYAAGTPCALWERLGPESGSRVAGS